MIIKENQDDRFYIAQSKIPACGNGLFAKKKLHKNDYVEIIGVKVKPQNIPDQCTSYANAYKFYSEYDKTLIIPMGYAGIINHGVDKINCQLKDMNFNHSWLNVSEFATGLIYQFTRDIEENEELLGDYGRLWASKFRKMQDEEKAWTSLIEKTLYNFVEIHKLFG